ncbi:hypothetical protein [Labrys sp. ZIDIC5]|uniref:hypothetical protein n=1 Tax=Labrys sedimenti TaxID=3106036 RepID=UPI002ACAEEF8|nr:hypothetical protein [Labrys sp. ZIDIC5]MDZ5454061.1 hypothetical protein [Labrys sp. ZIDIC5]
MASAEAVIHFGHSVQPSNPGRDATAFDSLAYSPYLYGQDYKMQTGSLQIGLPTEQETP